MPTVAKADVNDIYTEGHTFQFADGKRQVSEAEEQILRRYMANGGPVEIEFEQDTPKKKGKS